MDVDILPKKIYDAFKRDMMVGSVRYSFIAALIALFAASASAQSRSMITGFVKGPAGPVEKARLELRSEATMSTWRAETDRSGRFAFTNIGLGRYTLRVFVPGSDLIEQAESIEIGGGATAGNETVQVDFVLKARAASTDRAAGVIFAQDVPDEARRLCESAATELKRDNAQAAVNDLVKALDIFPAYFAALEMLGVQYMKHQMYAEARKAFSEAVAVNSRSYESWYGLSYAHFGLKDWAAAAAAAERAIIIDKTSSRAHFVLGMSQRSLKQHDAAERSMLKARELDRENNADIHWNLALLYAHNLNKYGKAADELELFLKATPDNPDAPNIRKLIASFRAKQSGK